METITTATGNQLAYQWSPVKDKPVLVLTHALGMNQSAWDDLKPLLSDHFSLLSWDLPGHGHSRPMQQQRVTAASLTKELLFLVDALEIDSFYYLGTSIGGVIGLSLLNDHTHRVKAMTLTNTGAVIGSAAVWNTRCERIEQETLAGIASEVVPRWFSQSTVDAQPELLPHWLSALENMHQDSYSALCKMLANTDLRTVKADGISVQLIAGQDDLATPVDNLAWLSVQLEAAQPVVFDNVGHIPSVEAPQLLAQSLIEFFGSQ